MNSLLERILSYNLVDYAQIFGGFATVIALIYAIKEYSSHKERAKYETYSKMNERYCSDPAIKKVLECLIISYYKNDFNIEKFKIISTIYNLSTNDRELFMRFFEELNYAIEKQAIEEEDACYYFGYYAIIAYLMGEDFIQDFNERGQWIRFKYFAEKMKSIATRKNWYSLEKEDGKIINKIKIL